jgi:hypothetical protein
MFQLCELLVIISGLALPLPVEFVRHASAAATVKGWDLPPTVTDGMDSLAFVSYCLFASMALLAITLSFLCALSGLDSFRTFELAETQISSSCCRRPSNASPS